MAGHMNIDQNQALVHIDAPQDAEIASLGAELNLTYIPFGEGGAAGSARQLAEDAKALSVAPAVSAQRTNRQVVGPLQEHRLGPRRCGQGRADRGR